MCMREITRAEALAVWTFVKKMKGGPSHTRRAIVHLRSH